MVRTAYDILTGESSSLFPSTKKQKLWKKLQKLDRQISKIEKLLIFDKNYWKWFCSLPVHKKVVDKRNRLDQERKAVRAKLKGIKCQEKI